jgi:cobalamin biosynthesis Mg chelatase CobN
MAEVLIESERRSYWQPDAERLSRLRDVFLAMESALE